MSSQQTPVVWASKTADISEAVVQEYNQKSGVPAPAGTAAKPVAPAATHHHPTTTSH
jgi:outer membrane protein